MNKRQKEIARQAANRTANQLQENNLLERLENLGITNRTELQQIAEREMPFAEMLLQLTRMNRPSYSPNYPATSMEVTNTERKYKPDVLRALKEFKRKKPSSRRSPSKKDSPR